MGDEEEDMGLRSPVPYVPDHFLNQVNHKTDSSVEREVKSNGGTIHHLRTLFLPAQVSFKGSIGGTVLSIG
ncbi:MULTISPECIES: hypothetical protein [unclassified Nostoc]|uniref:hypothetical protein n=1 Tax=unclassified Nostoc TaxID=2593658 RepID=UPI00260C9982|nr:hypothetical protein [Nostoc sp. S13]MDF5737557.1 hypothetical protein [Nostoc sp. S13]